MSIGNALEESKPQTIEANSLISIDSAAFPKKDSFHILHVDDDACILQVSKQILSMENDFVIESVTSVDEAFKKMEEQTYDAIVSDFEMPQKNGLDFLKELRQQQRDIPFILFTGRGREEVAIKALNLGADAYINKNGNPETVYGELSHALINSIERKDSKKLLIESEAKFHKLVENSLQGIAIIQGPPPKFVFANLAMKRIFGLSPEELAALSSEEIITKVHPADRETFFNRFSKRMQGKEVESTYEFRGIGKDGSIKWYQVCANLIEYNGRPAVQAAFLDISEHKKIEDSLRRSKEMYKDLADSLPEIIFETDNSGKLIYANEKAFEITGYTKEDLARGACAFDFFAQKDKERIKENFRKALENKPSDDLEYEFVRKDGSAFPVMIKRTPIVVDNKTVGLRGIAIDISGRKKKLTVLERK
jgi:PAS domain S-box-containing protein